MASLPSTPQHAYPLPEPLATSPWSARAALALQAVSSVGAALRTLRGAALPAREKGDQLKACVDRAAEAWVVALLRGAFPHDAILSEEAYGDSRQWSGARSYWTVDALDGTRSFVEGYLGFCAQVAWVEQGEPVLGVVCEPVEQRCFLAVRGAGAFMVKADRWRPLNRVADAPAQEPIFVDSTPPQSAVGALMKALRGRFLECGSIGLKACRIATGEAHIYAKKFRFRLWDVAPAHVVLREVGAELCLWTGKPIDYSSSQVEYQNLVSAPQGSLPSLVERLRSGMCE